MLRVTALCLATALPLQAQTALDPVPDFPLDSSIACLAYLVADAERNGPVTDPTMLARDMVFFARLIAAKSSPEDAADFDARYAEALTTMRALHDEMDQPAPRDQADEILTGTGKMCWFNALAAKGGPAYKE